MSWELIFEVGAEGGRLSVMGQQGESGEWSFLMVRDESTLKAFLDDLADEELYDECYAATWDGILLKMDKYPWPNLFPLGPFHEEFKGRIWNAVMAQGTSEYRLRDWQECCGQFSG